MHKSHDVKIEAVQKKKWLNFSKKIPVGSHRSPWPGSILLTEAASYGVRCMEDELDITGSTFNSYVPFALIRNQQTQYQPYAHQTTYCTGDTRPRLHLLLYYYPLTETGGLCEALLPVIVSLAMTQKFFNEPGTRPCTNHAI